MFPIGDLFLFLALLLVMGQSASWAVRAAISLSRILGWSEFAISFVLVTFVSIIPETTIAVLSAFRGVPTIGLGTLLGSNVADLTFVFGVVALAARRPLKVESSFIKKDYVFLAFLLLPILLGFTGYFSRIDGALLVMGSGVFFYLLLKGNIKKKREFNHAPNGSLIKTIGILISGLLLTGLSANYMIGSAAFVAATLHVTPALIGLLVIALGTTLPELLFSSRAARHAHPTLALGDVLGTVVADATLVLGITALIHPFAFNPRMVILTGLFMFLAGLFFFSLLRSGRELTKIEGVFLLLFYTAFVLVEFLLRNWTPLVAR